VYTGIQESLFVLDPGARREDPNAGKTVVRLDLPR
jgi:hypothetical protein